MLRGEIIGIIGALGDIIVGFAGPRRVEYANVGSSPSVAVVTVVVVVVVVGLGGISTHEGQCFLLQLSGNETTSLGTRA